MSVSPSYKRDFFSGKRLWSVIRDEILKHYLPPYLRKVQKLNRGIIIVDGFAGQGVFDDGSLGAPLIICDIVKEFVGNNTKIILVNKDKRHHQTLNSVLSERCQYFNIIYP